MADWKAIKTEYITTDTSYRKLGRKYGVSYNAIGNRARKEKWQELRDQYCDKTVTKTLDKISAKQSDKMARIDALADALLAKLEQAVQELDMQIITHKHKVETATTEETTEYREATTGGIVDRAGLRQLTAALKDIKDVKMIRSALDDQEQEARIAKLRREAEKDVGDDSGVIEVVFDAGPEEWNE